MWINVDTHPLLEHLFTKNNHCYRQTLITACLIGKNTGTIFVMCNLWCPKIVPTNKYHILSASFVKKIGPNIYHIFWKHKRSALWGHSDAIWHHWSLSSLFQVMAWCQTGPKPLPEPIMNTKERNFCEIEIEMPTSFFFKTIHFKKVIYKVAAILFRPQKVKTIQHIRVN